MAHPTRVFSHIVAHDNGFAPNPYEGFCTVACCKPVIRRVAGVGDYLVGLSSGSESVVYAMRVTEKLTFAQYWNDERFKSKRPQWKSTDERARRGDNIYEPLSGGGFRQLKSMHWDHDRDVEHVQNKRHDLKTDAVLVSNDFVYFGGNGPRLPPELRFLAIGRGQRSRFEPSQVKAVIDYFKTLPRGVQGRPGSWPSGDTSCDGRGPAPSC